MPGEGAVLVRSEYPAVLVALLDLLGLISMVQRD